KRPSKKWMWTGLGLLAFAIVVVVVVVPSVVVTRQKQHQNDYAHAISRYGNITQMIRPDGIDQKNRIFIIGDVHGCADELKQLVQKIGYNQDEDQIILAGDLVYRGPDNVGVLRYAKQVGAMCVRGNHDDIVIRLKTYMNKYGIEAMQPADAVMPEGDVEDPLKFGDDHIDVAKNMTQEDYDYLVSCPLILDLPSLNNSVVVHGGLDGTIDHPVDNDPLSILTMRDIHKGVPTDDNKDGSHWTKSWTPNRPNMNVYYGHDASRGLNLDVNTFGTDSGCVYGHELTALEMRSHQLTQVSCA
ncbi:Metallo-dependent phosphatase-like protein, partial [Syncephalastrum racemosum]